MISTTIEQLTKIVELAEEHLQAIDEETFALKESTLKWSKKEILGHLIDSVTNNHRRFLLAQFQVNPIVSYDQDNWCKYNHYQNIDNPQLIKLWKAQNIQLINLWKNLSSDDLQRRANDQTLEFLAADYNAHLVHHLSQITGRTYI
ncbi:DinB family protein [Sphingobacterium sp. BN32]|uniref:DinB family protein n=1 Tax=Sphingobacterium sp. BN32 TaxID=3058432 RepID=UPI00265D5EEB|nr:DinB family protein [Sphingobacterium sp. BN32]WKK60216.1 DinB family protein [Sphingobacterium sp. BN32]